MTRPTVQLDQLDGFRFCMPRVHFAKQVWIQIALRELRGVYGHLGHKTPVLFLYLRPETAANIRAMLGMTNPHGPFFDPCSKVINYACLDPSRPCV